MTTRTKTQWYQMTRKRRTIMDRRFKRHFFMRGLHSRRTWQSFCQWLAANIDVDEYSPNYLRKASMIFATYKGGMQ